MSNKLLIRYISSLISNGSLGEAGKLLEDIFDDSNETNMKNQVLLINARHHQLKQKETSGTYRDEDLSLERNRLIASYITLKDELTHLGEITHSIDIQKIPELLQPGEIVAHYREKLIGKRFYFPPQFSEEQKDAVFDTFGISTDSSQLFYFFFDASYWFGKPLGLLLTGNRLQARELLSQKREVFLNELEETSIQLINKWGGMRDLLINDTFFFRFDSMISVTESTLVKEFLYDMTKAV